MLFATAEMRLLSHWNRIMHEKRSKIPLKEQVAEQQATVEDLRTQLVEAHATIEALEADVVQGQATAETRLLSHWNRLLEKKRSNIPLAGKVAEQQATVEDLRTQLAEASKRESAEQATIKALLLEAKDGLVVEQGAKIQEMDTAAEMRLLLDWNRSRWAGCCRDPHCPLSVAQR